MIARFDRHAALLGLSTRIKHRLPYRSQLHWSVPHYGRQKKFL